MRQHEESINEILRGLEWLEMLAQWQLALVSVIGLTPPRSQVMTGCTLSLWRSGGRTPEVVPAVTHILTGVRRVAMSNSTKRLSRQPDGRFPAVLAVPAV
jgi:hypothetical protein